MNLKGVVSKMAAVASTSIFHNLTFFRAASGNCDSPVRVLPGRLSVSRALGDAHAKITKYGGNPKVIIAEPEIKAFNIDQSVDFVFLGCILEIV